MSTSTNVLITGTSRGLGKGLLERYLLKPNHTIIAANRNPKQPSSTSLLSLPTAAGSKLILVKLDANIETDPAAAIAELEKNHGITHLDIVIANAGVSYIWPTVADLKIGDLRAHVETNVYGVISLYQAVRPLLRKSNIKTPVFTLVGTTAGSVVNQPPLPNAAYGPSKAAASWIMVRINAEDGEWLTSFTLNPGLVETDLGKAGIAGLGVPRALLENYIVEFQDSVDGMLRVVDGVVTVEKVKQEEERERVMGKLVAWNGEITPW